MHVVFFLVRARNNLSQNLHVTSALYGAYGTLLFGNIYVTKSSQFNYLLYVQRLLLPIGRF